MGKGIEAARIVDPIGSALVDDLKDQLLIVFLKRLGGSIALPCAEVDDTAQDLFTVRVDLHTRTFHFEIAKKD
jgi:hypothetical protein